MKRCPECRRDYYDDTLSFCLADGAELVYGLADDEAATAILAESRSAAEFRDGDETRRQIHTAASEAGRGGNLGDDVERRSFFGQPGTKPLVALVLSVIILVAGFYGYRYFSTTGSKQVDSIAVMPFVNEGGEADLEYLSDGMTETLIANLAQLPNLNVKARSSVFRYKGKETATATIGKELNVQAVLNGRVIRRGGLLTLYVELVDARTENVLWKADYNRPTTNLVLLQTEIARDVSSRLRLKLSGADESRVTKRYTNDPEAYELYLKGRFFAGGKVTEEGLK